MNAAAMKSRKGNKRSMATYAVAENIRGKNPGQRFVNNRIKSIDISRLRAMRNDKVSKPMQSASVDSPIKTQSIQMERSRAVKSRFSRKDNSSGESSRMEESNNPTAPLRNEAISHNENVLQRMVFYPGLNYEDCDRVILADIALQHSVAHGEVYDRTELKAKQDKSIALKDGEGISICAHGEAGSLEKKRDNFNTVVEPGMTGKQIGQLLDKKINNMDNLSGAILVSACMSATPKTVSGTDTVVNAINQELNKPVVGIDAFKVNNVDETLGDAIYGIPEASGGTAYELQKLVQGETSFNPDSSKGNISKTSKEALGEGYEQLMQGSEYMNFIKKFKTDLNAGRDPFASGSTVDYKLINKMKDEGGREILSRDIWTTLSTDLVKVHCERFADDIMSLGNGGTGLDGGEMKAVFKAVEDDPNTVPLIGEKFNPQRAMTLRDIFLKALFKKRVERLKNDLDFGVIVGQEILKDSGFVWKDVYEYMDKIGRTKELDVIGMNEFRERFYKLLKADMQKVKSPRRNILVNVGGFNLGEL